MSRNESKFKKEQNSEIKNIILNIFNDKENKLLVLMGPSGSGKSFSLEDQFYQIEKIQNKDKNIFFKIYLNGYFHLNTNSILEKFWKDYVNIFGSQERLRSGIKTINAVMNKIKKLSKNGIFCIFIFDHFELFLKRFKKQTFIYSLLELFHSENIHLSIICLTVSVMWQDEMEKRVRSRFSDYKVVYFNNCHNENDVAKYFKTKKTSQIFKSIRPQLKEGLSLRYFKNLRNVIFASNKSSQKPKIGLAGQKSLLVNELPLVDLTALCLIKRLESLRPNENIIFEMILKEYNGLKNFVGDSLVFSEEALLHSIEKLEKFHFVSAVNFGAVARRSDFLKYSNLRSCVDFDQLKNSNLPIWFNLSGIGN